MRVHTTPAISTRTLDEAAREAAVLKHEVVVQTATLSSITTRVDVSAYVITCATGSKAERRRALTRFFVEGVEAAADSLLTNGVAVGAGDTGNTNTSGRSWITTQRADSLILCESTRTLTYLVLASRVDVKTYVTNVTGEAKRDERRTRSLLLEISVTADTHTLATNSVAVDASNATRGRCRGNQTRCFELATWLAGACAGEVVDGADTATVEALGVGGFTDVVECTPLVEGDFSQAQTTRREKFQTTHAPVALARHVEVAARASG